MRVMVKYKKSGPAVYISHLDVQRAMQRALRRTKMPVKYSMGFHPHVVLTFAQPLPVAVTSRAEYMEFGLKEALPPAVIRDRLNACLPPGLYALDSGYLPDKAPSLMALVCRCDWDITLSDVKIEGVQQKIVKLLSSDKVMVEKESKKGLRQVDIRPGVITCNAVQRGNKVLIETSLMSGGKMNVAPKMLLAGMGIDPRYADIERSEIYYDNGGEHFPLNYLIR